jgi:hypothetical protein
MKTQKMTLKRSAITIEQQYRWFQTYGQAVKFLRENNTGLCKETGTTCGELNHPFIIGGDETCMLARDAEESIIGEEKKSTRKNLPTLGCL